MDPISFGTIVAGVKTGIDTLKTAAETVSAIRNAASGPTSQKTVTVDTDALGQLAEDLATARVRTLDVLTLAERLQTENLDLREAIRKKEQFAVRREQYQLTSFNDGAVAFKYAPKSNDITPTHLACPTCFEDEKISHLQPDVVDFGTTKMKCGRCGTVVPVPNNHRMESYVVDDYSPFGR